MQRCRFPRRRWARAVLGIVAVLAVAAVGTDRVLAAVAAGRVAGRLQCALGLPGRPDVSVDGFPFVPQLLTGRYHRIDATAEDLRRGEVRLASVHATLHDLAPSGTGTTVGRATVEAVAGFDALPAQLGGRPVTYGAADGMLAVVTAASVGGQQLPVTLLGRPAIVDGALRVEPQEVEILGVRRPAKGLLDRLGARTVSRPLPALPAGLSYRSVAVRPEGLAVTVTGTNLSLSSPRFCGARR